MRPVRLGIALLLSLFVICCESETSLPVDHAPSPLSRRLTTKHYVRPEVLEFALENGTACAVVVGETGVGITCHWKDTNAAD